jgi:hypothetical protein
MVYVALALLILSGCSSAEPVATAPQAAPDERPSADAPQTNSLDSPQPMPKSTSNEDKNPASSENTDSPAPASTATDTKPASPPPVEPAPSADSSAETDKPPASPPPEVAGLRRLDPKYQVWIDPQQKRVLVGGEVVRQEGQLEMFACLKNTKEHESIVAADTKAYIVNAALIALGANPGGPVQFRPEFKPASGPEVEVTAIYTDKDGKRREVKAQEWIRNIKTGKQLDQPWVFGGSGFWEDESTGQKHFMAEDGDFICISNFNSAMLDLPVESSQASADLMFEAFTDRIPPVKTPVLLVLKPKIDAKASEAKTDEESK